MQRGEPGAADRLVAPKALEERLAAIIKGEPPFDIFVRWKPVHEQPVVWEPDINDGVRLNIRPFMSEDFLEARRARAFFAPSRTSTGERTAARSP